MRILLKQCLRALGVRATAEANDGAQAFSVMKLFQPDVILVDWEMEPLDGVDFVKLVRTGEDSPNRYVPIIMVTGHSEHNRVTRARDCGVNELLIKPVSANSLYQRVRSIVEHPRSYVESRTYFGPDRRRKQVANFKGPDRRAEAA
ncbi:MAG: response regulator [Rhodospirillales bacterium]|nr:response regulator [Rhodospirillales bacterium]